MNAGEGRWAPVARKDIGAAVAVLSTAGHDNRFYNITGPELVSYREFAKLLTRETGKPAKYVALDDARYSQWLIKNGMSDADAQDQVNYFREFREGMYAVKSTAVRDLTGREPQSVSQLLEANKAVLTAAPAGLP